MSPTSKLRRLAPVALLLGSVGLAAPAHAGESPEVEKALAAVKAAHDKYMDPKVAVAEGFVATDECVESPDGVMGYHYVNEKLMGPIDQNKPPILVYQPDGNGGRKLVAVEYFKPDADQNLDTADDKPSLFGRGFDGPMEGHSPGMPKHYDLHAWLWQTNPEGVLADYNKAGTCNATAGATTTGATTTGAHTTGATTTGEHTTGATTTGATTTGAQVSVTPTGGAHTGEGGAAATGDAWLFALGGLGLAAGGVLLAGGARASRRRG